MEEQWNHPIRALLKVRWTFFVWHCLSEWKFSIHLCSRICWFEDNPSRIDSINQRNTRWCHTVENPWKLSINSFCIATQLQFWCTSIIADLSNAEWIDPICIATDHSASSTVTELSLNLSTIKAPSRWRVQDVYHWNPTSGDNIQVRIRRPDNAAVELWSAGGRCQYSRMPPLESPVAADIK